MLLVGLFQCNFVTCLILWFVGRFLWILLSGVFIQEFEESGDPEKHFQALLSLAKQGIEKGKVGLIASTMDNIR